MRLWSTVASQLAKRPWVHGTGYVGVSALVATEPLLEVIRQRLHLAVVPLLAYRRHLAAPVAHDLGDDSGVRDGAGAQARADEALALLAVAFRAGAVEDLLAEVGLAGLLAPGLLCQPRVELVGLHHLDRREHLRMLDP